MLGQEAAKPGDRVGVEVVRGLVEKQRGLGLTGASRCREKNLR